MNQIIFEVKMTVSFKNIFFFLATTIALVTVLYLAKALLVPLAFAILFSFMLYPVVKWINTKKVNWLLSISIVMLGVFVLLACVLLLFSTQIAAIVSEFEGFIEKLKSTLDTVLAFLNQQINITPELESQDFWNRLSSYFSDSGLVIISDTISLTSSFFSYLFLSFIYTFLLLFYHDHFVKGLSMFSKEKHRDRYMEMLGKVQKVGQQYFVGMMLLILILGLLNSVGLLLLGLDYPFFFGFLASLLAVVPYIGTTIGSLIPALYAYVSYDSYWYPLGVIGVFWVIQFLEGNFLTPKIVGGSMRINALVSILSLISGGILWGVSGMVLFLPMIAILRVVCEYYDNLTPLAVLLGDVEEPKQGRNGLIKVLNMIKS